MNEKLRLKDDLIFQSKIDYKNRIELSKAVNISRNTVYALLGEKATQMRRVDLDTFGKLFIEGFGYTPEEVLNIRLGELFTFEAD